MIDIYSFGEWMKQRRKNLRLTQREVAAATFCSVAMIKKIEADERQPSVELAQALATTMQIPSDQHDIFVKIARGERPLDHLIEGQKNTETEQLHSPSLPRTSAPPLPTPMLATLDIRAKNWVLNLTLGSVGRQLKANPGGRVRWETRKT